MRICFLFALLYFTIASGEAQHKIRYNERNLPALTFGKKNNDGFSATLSLVAVFTTGAADRNGFRIGAGIGVMQRIGDWSFSTGVDACKATEKFGFDMSYAGVGYDNGNYGLTYYANKYYQGDKQTSGMVRLHLDDFRISFEDDILAMPFTGFKIYDRYRTAGLEIQYRHFLIGSNVYTSDINGVTDATSDNSKGTYITGKQISSPIYIGYTTHNMIARYGFNNKNGGFWMQNGWHRQFFSTPDFSTGIYNNQFLQIGTYRPYTLY